MIQFDRTWTEKVNKSSRWLFHKTKAWCASAFCCAQARRIELLVGRVCEPATSRTCIGRPINKNTCLSFPPSPSIKYGYIRGTSAAAISLSNWIARRKRPVAIDRGVLIRSVTPKRMFVVFCSVRRNYTEFISGLFWTSSEHFVRRNDCDRLSLFKL